MPLDKLLNSDDAVIHVSNSLHNIVASEAKKWGINNKEYVEFCVKFCKGLNLDPTSTNHRTISKKINSKRNEESLLKSFTDTRNTIIGFIRTMEKEELGRIYDLLLTIENRLINESKVLAINQQKSIVLTADMLAEILTDDPKMQQKFFKKYMEKLNAH